MTFTAGMSGEISGVEWRTVTGAKGPGDIRLDLRARNWVAVSMGLGALMADVFFQNEERLYPLSSGFQGGEQYLAFLRGATVVGWDSAYSHLLEQRSRRNAA